MHPRAKPAPHAPSVRCFEDATRLHQALAGLLRRTLQPHPALRQKGIMLAGGQTPLATYALLAASPGGEAGAAYLCLSDERMVPFDSPDSNYGALAGLVRALGIGKDHVLTVDSSLSPQAAADRYDRELRTFLEAGGRLVLGLLGLGTDGHTASLFTSEDLARAAGRYAVAVHRPDGHEGVSVTPALLRHVERLLVVAVGAPKREMVETLLQRPDSIPAGQAIAGHPAVEVWADERACPGPDR